MQIFLESHAHDRERQGGVCAIENDLLLSNDRERRTNRNTKQEPNGNYFRPPKKKLCLCLIDDP